MLMIWDNSFFHSHPKSSPKKKASRICEAGAFPVWKFWSSG